LTDLSLILIKGKKSHLFDLLFVRTDDIFVYDKNVIVIGHQLSVNWKEEERTSEQHINELQQLKYAIDTTIKDYERQLDEKRNQLKDIEFNLNKKQKVVEKKLVKPHRGFIMFGPPGKIKTIFNQTEYFIISNFV
jgi:SpoVK/Ycf46/Vps4 family AAA+-type ATPase